MSAALGSRMYSASRYLAPLARRTIAGHAIRSFQTVTPTHLWAVRFAPLASRSSSVVGRSFQQHRFASSLAVGDVYDVVVPTMGDSITEGTIVTWVKQPGEYVAPDEVYCVVETDKVTVDINATQGGGILKEILAEEGDNVEVGAVFAKFEYTEPPAGGAPVAKDDSPPTPPAPPAAPAASTPPAPPASAPTPPASAPPAMKPSPAPSAPAAAAASSEGDRTEKRVKMTRMRKRIAERLTESQETAVMLTTFNEVDMSKLMALRKKYKDQFEKVHGVKLGFMSAFVRAATVALQEVPAVNAIIDGDHIVFRDYVDISVAVSSPRGLVVPVLRDTQKMSFADVEREIGILGAKARNDTITLEEMTGGTFSVTNGGVFGSLMSTPIINMPQSAILGMHGIKERPVVVDGEIVARPMMYIALTYDHRLIDGRESVTFLKSIKEKVEDPERFLLGL